MNSSVTHIEDQKYKVTIASSNDLEVEFMSGNITEITPRVQQYYDNAVKENLGEEYYILSILDDSNLPNEIIAIVTK